MLNHQVLDDIKNAPISLSEFQEFIYGRIFNSLLSSYVEFQSPLGFEIPINDIESENPKIQKKSFW